VSTDYYLKRFSLAVFLGLTTLLTNPAYAVNEVMLDLLKILRDKGSLTDSEYELLRTAAMADGEEINGKGSDIKQDVKTVEEEVIKVTKDMGWANKIKLKGDIRLRYQHQSEDGVASDRDRGRVRYRLGIIAKPAEGWEVGAGLASGGSDLRSTNQSFDSTFSTKGINLDYAYAQYQFNENFTGIGGKFQFKNYLYTATDLMWDGDINPEGFSINYSRNNGLGATFANGGIWVLEENSSSDDDPFMYYLQLGQNFGSGNMFGTIAGTYYNFEEINKLGDIVTDGTNTDFRFSGIFSLSGELGMKDVFGSGSRVSIIADWVTNNDTDTPQDNGYSIGLKASQGNWSFKYIYADMEENAWPDILPDSDRFDGLTGIDGHEFIIDYDLMKNVTLGLDYYNIDIGAINQDLFQFDVVVKF